MPNSHYYGLILAGGRGTRFWPRSRKRSAKQVLNVFGERSLIQSTVDRLKPVIAPEHLWVVTSRDLRDAVVGQLPEIPPSQILAEPAQRNTAPAIGLAAQVLASQDPRAVMGVFPADHLIARPAAFRQVVRAAFRGAQSERLMVVGIQPRWPETGYGYIEFPRGLIAKPRSGRGTNGLEPLAVKRFHEKPPLAKAKRYLAAGNFYWNSGMFFWQAEVLLEALRRHAPRTATVLAALPPFASPNFPGEMERVFPLCENISIDFAVMERAENVSGIAAADFGWSDVGSWNAVYELMPRDGCGNVAARDHVCLDAHNNFVDARGKMVALVGVKDLIVVDTADALLIADRSRAQQVGEVVKALERQKRHDLL